MIGDHFNFPVSRPSSGNISGTDLNTGVRKSSTCSSTGSGWNIDIPPPTGSKLNAGRVYRCLSQARSDPLSKAVYCLWDVMQY